MRICYILFLILLIASVVNCSSILFLAPFPGRSQWIFLVKFIEQLIRRGHQITAITTFPYEKQLENYTEILIHPQFDFGNFDVEIYNTDAFANPFHYAWEIYKNGPDCSIHGFEHPDVQKFIQQKDLHFDLIIVDLFKYESWYMFAYQFNAPIIGINTFGCTQFYDSAMGLITPFSHVSNWMLGFSDQMIFRERFYNTMYSIWDHLIRTYYFIPKHNEIAWKYFKHLEKYGPLPSIKELETSISIILTNDHRSITAPRPQMPGIVHIGGAHITQPEPLPSDIQEFLDNSPDGVILFSLGTNVQSSFMPKEKLKAFLDAFGTLTQKVLWKYENKDLDNIPSNVMISKWIPQSDVLGHKNVILFITHGGLFGTIEGLERGVPSLCIPLFADQYRNSQKAIRLGYGLMLKFGDVTKETLTDKINELLTNPKYKENVRKISHLFRDNPIHPMDEGIFWIEYVIRHKGAKHLKSAALNLSVFSYLSLDVAAVFFATILTVMFIIYIVTKIIFHKLGKCFNNKAKQTIDKKIK